MKNKNQTVDKVFLDFKKYKKVKLGMRKMAEVISNVTLPNKPP